MPFASFLELARDPLLFYSLLAGIFLAFVSLLSGWLRKDFLPLFSPRGLLHALLAVLAAVGLLFLHDGLQYLLPYSPITLPIVTTEGWPIEGSSRLPLYLVSLAYGPSAGLFAGGLFAAFNTDGNLPGWPEAVLTLELIILGWLAILPSPRRHRWAGPLNALLAYALAWATAGLALLRYETVDVSLATLWAQQKAHLGGALLTVLLLFVFSPLVYRTLFPHSRIGDDSGRPVVPLRPSRLHIRRDLHDVSPPVVTPLEKPYKTPKE